MYVYVCIYMASRTIHINNIIKIIITIKTPPSQPLLTTTNHNNNITKSVSYHNQHNQHNQRNNFNVEKYIEDEKKYIKKMIKYYNQS
jgi:hypothetical protein